LCHLVSGARSSHTGFWGSIVPESGKIEPQNEAK